MKQIYVTQLIEHLAEEMEETFYLKYIYENFTKETGTPYFFLKLQDKSGSIIGRIWDNNMNSDYVTFKGKVVKVYGEVLYDPMQKLEFIISRMEIITEYNISDYVTGLSPTETQHYREALYKQINLVKHANYKDLLYQTLDSIMPRLCEAPASITNTGCFNGGLLVQIVSVTSIAIQLLRSQKIYAYHPDLKISYNEDLLITGAVLFGIGIINLYSPFPEAEKIHEYSLVPKPLLSIQIIEETVFKENLFLSVEEKNMLYHAIYCAFDKSLKPMNRESLILQMAYSSYIQICGLEAHLTEHQQERGAIYVPKLKNFLYMPKEEGGSADE
ncbi:MAG: hypothetical protein PHW34_09115 [Hespellia sp.]|nr:hypothetical protein [Hespellia sp.]